MDISFDVLLLRAILYGGVAGCCILMPMGIIGTIMAEPKDRDWEIVTASILLGALLGALCGGIFVALYYIVFLRWALLLITSTALASVYIGLKWKNRSKS